MDKVYLVRYQLNDGVNIVSAHRSLEGAIAKAEEMVAIANFKRKGDFQKYYAEEGTDAFWRRVDENGFEQYSIEEHEVNA